MFLSIMMPVYNCEQFLDGCIASCMNQTFQDFELILVDDGSSDKSGIIADSWQKKSPDRIKVVHKQNEGAYFTRKRCMKEASGEFFFFIDADDRLIGKDSLEKIHDAVEETNCDLLFFDASTKIDKSERMFRYPYHDLQIFEDDNLSEIYRLFLDTKKFQHLWNKVFHRRLADLNTVEDSFSFRMLRDGPYQIVPIISKTKKAAYLDEVLYYYRNDNSASVSHNFRSDFFFSVIALHKRILQSAANWEHKDSKTDIYVNKAFMTDIFISAVKARNLRRDENISKREYLKIIANDPFFRERYCLREVERFRKPVLILLYKKRVFSVLLISEIVGICRNIIK